MITLKDKLSHLSYIQACKLLGPQGKQLILEGGKYDIDPLEQVTLNNRRFSLNLEGAEVEIVLDPKKPKRLKIGCSACAVVCEHQGAALSLILEEKLTLGLSAPPPERIPMESLSDEALVKEALADRTQRAQAEKMRLRSLDPRTLWTDYILTSQVSGKSYRIALRGWELGASYCTCPDFRKNTLGTCKHIIYALDKVRRKFNKTVRETPAEISDICVFLRYGQQLQLGMLIPDNLAPEVTKHLKPFKDRAIQNVKDLIRCIRRVESLDAPVTIYPDAEEYINQTLFQQRMADTVAGIRKNPEAHALRRTLLKTELLPYQLDGVAFAAGAGRAILADDMGLGKTIQGIGVAEMLSTHASISKVLVICPASLKSQWRLEIKRFSNRSCQLVLGSAKERPAQYDSGSFFTVCNYEQVLRDFLSIERVRWDLIILEENLLATLSAKHELFQAVLDPDSDTTRVDMATGMEELKRRLEILLGEKPDAAEDESMRQQVEKEAEALAKKEKIAAAGGKLVGAAFAFIGEMFTAKEESEEMAQLAGAFKSKLSDCMEKADDGTLKMTISLPDEAFLDNMARSLAQMVSVGRK